MLTERHIQGLRSPNSTTKERVEAFVAQMRPSSPSASLDSLHFSSPTASQRQQAEAAATQAMSCSPKQPQEVLEHRPSPAHSATLSPPDEPGKRKPPSEDGSLLQPYYALAHCQLVPDACATQHTIDSIQHISTPQPYQRRPRAKPRKRDADGRILPKTPPPKGTRTRRPKPATILAKKSTLPGASQPSRFVNTSRRVTLPQKYSSMSKHAKAGGVPDLTFPSMQTFARRTDDATLPVQENAPTSRSATPITWSKSPSIREPSALPFLASVPAVGSTRLTHPPPTLLQSAVHRPSVERQSRSAVMVSSEPPGIDARDERALPRYPLRIRTPPSPVLPNIFTHRRLPTPKPVQHSHATVVEYDPGYAIHAMRAYPNESYRASTAHGRQCSDLEYDCEEEEHLTQSDFYPQTAQSEAPVAFWRPFRRG
ncbi:hypothetical protein BCR37DRAFT_392951 [Protomyces lactucae-debilis]|uniref:Uncharacterized protein n=1 Tax=Protomyces lactucae-debilis TaxID=2754530 RepID=A0A1Y2FD97_PROLT|nr:uncharacterized protein BCR37DRAFT_392951 [Protomyces lactucae-debilis]ORY81898.1 hypothetical protein BCR37DRAFT_392951 [Protomyces lactucae-debilis]